MPPYAPLLMLHLKMLLLLNLPPTIIYLMLLMLFLLLLCRVQYKVSIMILLSRVVQVPGRTHGEEVCWGTSWFLGSWDELMRTTQQ